MMLHRPAPQLRRARIMRSAPTKAEDILWRSLRGSGIGVRIRRQVPIGPYIADFACLPAKLVIELDGPPHDKPDQQARDRQRDAWLARHGWRVLRVPNEIVFGGGDMVLDKIKVALSRDPSSDPASRGHLLPQAGEGGGVPAEMLIKSNGKCTCNDLPAVQRSLGQAEPAEVNWSCDVAEAADFRGK